MKALIWSVRIVVFLVLFAFAAKNTEPVVLRLFFGATWHVPLVLLLFGALALGALGGVLAMSGKQYGLRRKLRHLQKNQGNAGEKPVELRVPAVDA